MTCFRPSALLPIALGLAVLAPGDATAAKSFDACTGFIDSVPATITSQGVWCLRKDLSTGITSGAAITIDANNVTIDCNDFRLGGLPAGSASLATGIEALGRQNTTVRNCNIRGFQNGVTLGYGAGHLVEDNRFDNNLVRAVLMPEARNSVVRRNLVFDTGGHTNAVLAVAIHVDSADVLDNTIRNVFVHNSGQVSAIWLVPRQDNQIRGNRISGVTPGSDWTYGIRVEGGRRVRIVDNVVVADGFPGSGISGGSVDNHACAHNTVAGFSVPIYNCYYANGNDLPGP